MFGLFERDDAARVVVPASWHVEVAAVLARRFRSRAVNKETLDRALRTVAELPLETRLDLRPVREIVENALRYDVQAGDALYLELALATNLTGVE